MAGSLRSRGWQRRGFESPGAAQSARQQFGLIQTEPGGAFRLPTMASVQRQFTNPESPNYRPVGGTGVTPLDIGGARWNYSSATGGLDYTGQASDAAGGGGAPYNAARQVPYGAPKPISLRTGPGGPQSPAGPRPGPGGGRLRQAGPPSPLSGIPGMNQPHTQLGQSGKGTGMPKPPPSGGAQPTPVAPQAGAPGAFPKAPPKVPNFLPMTPGYEAAYRGANDRRAAAEGAYAASGALLPAQVAQQQARLGTDQGVATDRLREQLAERGIYTPYGAGSTVMNPEMATSPGGGGVGEALYNRHVATPYGRQRQDLGASVAEAYQNRALDYGGAQLGFNQTMLDALLGRANDAYKAMPLSLPIGGYELPEMAGAQFSTPPEGVAQPGRNRNRNGGRNRGRRGGRGSRRK